MLIFSREASGLGIQNLKFAVYFAKKEKEKKDC
jgi:hypothetical protein